MPPVVKIVMVPDQSASSLEFAALELTTVTVTPSGSAELIREQSFPAVNLVIAHQVFLI